MLILPLLVITAHCTIINVKSNDTVYELQACPGFYNEGDSQGVDPEVFKKGGRGRRFGSLKSPRSCTIFTFFPVENLGFNE